MVSLFHFCLNGYTFNGFCFYKRSSFQLFSIPGTNFRGFCHNVAIKERHWLLYSSGSAEPVIRNKLEGNISFDKSLSLVSACYHAQYRSNKMSDSVLCLGMYSRMNTDMYFSTALHGEDTAIVLMYIENVIIRGCYFWYITTKTIFSTYFRLAEYS